MKLTIKQDNLAKALSSVGRIATAKTGLPILANILLQTDDNKLVISATNLEVAIVTTVGADIKEQGAITVPAKLLADFVNNLPHVNVFLETDDNKLMITADTFNSTINCAPADDYPALPNPTKENSLAIESNILRQAITKTVVVTSNDTTRPILTGVYMHAKNGKLCLAATDGYRLAEANIATKVDEISAIIPGNTLSDVARQLDSEKEIIIGYNDEQITFEIGNTSIISRLIDGKYISYQQLIPSENVYNISVDRQDLIKITKIAELFSREAAGSIIIEMDKKDKTLSVRSILSQIGNNSSKIEADIITNEDEIPSISINSKFLMDGLNCIDDSIVDIGFNSKSSPVVLRGHDKSKTYIHMIMPVKS